MSDEETELNTETLRGDIRDRILTEFKHIPNVWPKMAESEQERLISRAQDIAGELVRKAVDLIAERGLPALPIEVGKITIDGGACKGTFECYADDENLLRIRHLQGKRAMFVLASPDAFNGEQARQKPTSSAISQCRRRASAPTKQQLAQVGQGQAA
jgi:hypothetical protein